MEEVKTVIDNTKDWYDLADTTVKIGLGAFIGGLFTYITTKSNHKHEISKEKFNRKITMLDEATGKVEEYFKSSFILVDRWYGMANKKITKVDQLPNKSFNTYLEIDKTYIDTARNIQSSLAQFNILGLKELNNLVTSYDSHIIKTRNTLINMEEDIPSKEDIQKIMSETEKIKTLYYKKVKEYFDSLE